MNASKPDLYSSLIQSTLFTKPGLSRADLSMELGIDRAMVTRISQDLLEQGIVREGESVVVSPGAGRRPISLFLNDQNRCILGLEVLDQFIKVGWFTVYGKQLGSHTYFPEKNRELFPWLLGIIQLELEKVVKEGWNFWAIGLALSGLVNPESGQLLFSPHLGVRDTPLGLRDLLEQALKIPVFIDNDAKCCCYDVMTYGELQDRQNFLYLFGELIDDEEDVNRFGRIGIGTALVLDGKIQYGAHSAAGEFRSVFVPPDVPGQLANPKQYCLIKSDTAQRLVFLEELCRNMAFLVTYLDLEAIHFGGGIEVFRQEAEPILREAIQNAWLYRDEYPKPVAIYFTSTGEKPALRGAVALAARKLFLP